MAKEGKPVEIYLAIATRELDKSLREAERMITDSIGEFNTVSRRRAINLSVNAQTDTANNAIRQTAEEVRSLENTTSTAAHMIQESMDGAATRIGGLKDLFRGFREGMQGGSLSNITGELGRLSETATIAGESMQGFWRLAGNLAMGGAIIAGIEKLEEKTVELAKPSIERLNALSDAVKALQTDMATMTDLKVLFDLGGVEFSDGVTSLNELQKAFMDTGEEGERTRQALQVFGVSLADSNGDMLQGRAALDALATGYQTAASMGLEAEYMERTHTGALQELLEKYDALSAVVVNPPQIIPAGVADELDTEIRALETQMEYFSNAMGEALAPAAAEILPSLTALFAELNKVIGDNRETIITLSRVIGRTFAAASNLIGNFIVACEQLGPVLSAVGDGFKALAAPIDAIIQKIAALSPETAAAYENLKNLDLATIYDLRDDLDYSLQDIQIPPIDTTAAEEAMRILSGESEKTADEWEKQAQRMQESMDKAAAEIDRINSDLDSKIYKLTHSAMEGRLYDLDKEVSAMIEKGADEGKAALYQQLQAEKIMQEEVKRQPIQQQPQQPKTESIVKDGMEQQTKMADILKGLISPDMGDSTTMQRMKLFENTMKQIISYQTEKLKEVLMGLGNSRNDTPALALAQVRSQPTGEYGAPEWLGRYEKTTESLRTMSPAITLNVNVDGLGGVSDEVAQEAARKILERIPAGMGTRVNMGY